MKASNKDSLRKRYFYKLSTGIISLPIQLIIQSIIPRSLGPVAYGQFTFLSNSFTQVISFFDSGVAYAYYTKLSGDLNNIGLINYFFRLIIFLSLIAVLVTTGIIFLNLDVYIWPDQKVIFIYMALFWALINLYSSILNKTVDAYGLTSSGELIKISQKVFSLVLILGLYFFLQIDLFSFFLYHYVVMIFFIIGSGYILKKNGVNFLKLVVLTKNQVKELTSYFWNYSSPMIIFSFIGMIVSILDYLLLQTFSGSVEQGYFGLSYRIASICFIFTGAMTPLIIREFSVAFSNKNIPKIRSLFVKNIPMLYTIAAAISVFLCIEGNAVTQIIGGEKFKEAGLAISLMTLYPIHQTYGQLSGSVFYATGQTKLYRNIGVSIMVSGLIVSFFLISPQKFYGLNLGAMGLAIKMLIMQFIGVNIELFFNSKYLNLNFKKLVGHQILIVILFLSFAFCAKYFSAFVFENNLLSFLLSGVIYLIFILVLLYNFPILISIKKEQIKEVKIVLLNKITGKDVNN
jgi:O-antigen/teichoic acid export membrane protein